MEATTNNDSKPPPLGSSHWDKLPYEIKIAVLKYSSMLRPYLDGRLKLDSYKDSETIHTLWLEAFDFNWPESLKCLPEPHECLKLRNIDLSMVKSRSMYERLCQRFPKATEANAGFAETDKVTEEHKGTNDATIPSLSDVLLHGPLRLLHIPMRHMWLDLLGDTLDKFPYARAQDCIIEGYTNLLRHLVHMGRIDLSRIKNTRIKQSSRTQCFYPMDTAAGRGHLEIVKMFHETGCRVASTIAMDKAACNSHLDIVKWLHENHTEGCTKDAMDDAASNGHVDVIKWPNKNRTEGCTRDAMDYAAENGHLDIIKFLHDNRNEGCTAKAMDYAAENGHLDVVEWLHENRTEGCTTWAMYSAACRGRLDIVKFLHENRTEGCTTNVIDNAVLYNRLNVVRFLLENRTEGFSDDAIIKCTSNEIAELLVSKMSNERMRNILEDYRRWGWSGPGVDALERSLRGSR